MSEAAGEMPRAFVLAAGLGTRLRPLTDRTPKPLLPILGRPLLHEVCLALAAAGCAPIGINTHHLASQVVAWSRRWRDRAHPLTLFHEPRILGTGGALWNARRWLAEGEDFLLHNGDVLTDCDLMSLLGRHRRCGAVATLALTSWPQVDSVLVAPDGAVVDIGGKLGIEPPAGARRLTYTGVAALSRELLERLPAGPSSLIDALLALIHERPGSVRGWQPPRLYWNDIGTPERYWQAHADVLLEQLLRPRGSRRPANRIFRARGSHVPATFWVEGFASIGRGARIGSRATLRDSIILPGAVVGPGEEINWRIVGPDCRIPIRPTPDHDSGWPAHEVPATLLEGKVRARLGRDRPRRFDHPLLRLAGFGPRTRASLLPGGSDRFFWRVREGRRTAVLMEAHPRDPETARWLRIANWLSEENLGGPRVLADGTAATGAVLMEDLGEASLELLAADPRGPDEALYEIFDLAVETLVDLQVRGTASLQRHPGLVEHRFDYEDLRWETAYFRQRFLGQLAGVPGERLRGLEEDFHRLALLVLAQPQVVMHRDFQSRNLLLCDWRIHMVDFQAVQLGPQGYDLASLIRDPYLDLDASTREFLRLSYREHLREAGGPELSEMELLRLEVTAGLQRVMQAIGAFAHLGLVRGRREFLAHVPAGLAQLSQLLAEWRDISPAGLPRGLREGPLPDLQPLAGLVRDLRRRSPEAWRRGDVR